MARRKKPENETHDEAVVRRQLETIADAASRGEKVSWDRKMDNMVTLLARLKPIEDKILDLMSSKMPIMDEIAALRKEMVRDCVHPYTHLLYQGENTIACKFCNKTFAIVNQ